MQSTFTGRAFTLNGSSHQINYASTQHAGSYSHPLLSHTTFQPHFILHAYQFYFPEPLRLERISHWEWLLLLSPPISLKSPLLLRESYNPQQIAPAGELSRLHNNTLLYLPLIPVKYNIILHCKHLHQTVWRLSSPSLLHLFYNVTTPWSYLLWLYVFQRCWMMTGQPCSAKTKHTLTHIDLSGWL